MHLTDPPAAGSGFLALLKNRPFLTLWGGQVLSQVGDKVFFVLLIALLESYRSPVMFENSMRSVLMVAVTLPAILFGSAAGILVDRFPKKQILVICNLVRGLLTLFIPLLPKQFLILLAIAFIESTLTQFFAPAEQAAIPLTVERQQLISANALFTTTIMGSLIVGFAIGEPLLSQAEQIGEYGPELFTAGLYLAATAVLNGVPDLREENLSPELKVHPWQDFKAGLSYLKNDRLVSSALIQLTILYSVFAALTVLAINLAEKIGLKSTQFGFLLAAAGVGMVLGAGVLGQWGERAHNKPLPLAGFLIMAFVLGGFSFIQGLKLGVDFNPWLRMLSLGLSILLGFGASLIGVPMQTLIQKQTPEAVRGKVFGFQNNLVNIALSVPLAIAGPLADWIGLGQVLLGMSIIVGVGGIWSWQRCRNILQDAI
jgi:MFS family permease